MKTRRMPLCQDLLRRMLKLDPNERASIPEIFNHIWLRFRNVMALDQQVRGSVERSTPPPAPRPRHSFASPAERPDSA